jgi:hypothetical protein
MTDVIKRREDLPIKFKDMGDGTFAEIFSTSGGGGGGSALADVVLQDTNGVLVLVRDDGATLTYLRLDTGIAYTPILPLVAYTAPVTGPLTNAQLRASSVPVTGPLTDAQLRASVVPVSLAGVATSSNQTTGNTSLSNIDSDLGAQADAAATTDTGTFSLIAFIKRGLQNWTTLLTRIPTQVTPSLFPVDTLAAVGVARQLASGATSVNTALTTTCRRISIHARIADIRYAIGTGTQTASSTSHYIAMGERLDLNVPASAQIAVIRSGTTDAVLEVSELTL